jgi:serine protease Do
MEVTTLMVDRVERRRCSSKYWFILTVLPLIVLYAGCVGSDDGVVVTSASATELPVMDTVVTLQGLPSLAPIVSKVMPFVVSITTEQLRPQFFYQIAVPGAGTGIVVQSDGHIVTNDHVIAGARSISVTLHDGRQFEAQVIGRDLQSDLAVIKIDATGLLAANVTDSSGLMVGDWVMAVGNALSLEGGNTVTIGIVSALGRTILTDPYEDIYLYETIQTDAAINEGNSGGPLIDMDGNVVGINVAIESTAQGIGFAIPWSTVKTITEELVATGRVIRPMLGVIAVELTPSIARSIDTEWVYGVLLLRVFESTSAAEIGLQSGDVITHINGEDVGDIKGFRQIIGDYKIGDILQIVINREGNPVTLEAVLQEKPESVSAQIL